MEEQDDFTLQPKTKKLGNLTLSKHCHERMTERGVKQADVLAAAHGHRYNQANGKVLCVSLEHKAGIILNPQTNTVITVLPKMTAKKLKKRLGKRVAAKNASIKTEKSYPMRAPEVDEYEAFRINEDELDWEQKFNLKN
jgi:hypothetical protein